MNFLPQLQSTSLNLSLKRSPVSSRATVNSVVKMKMDGRAAQVTNQGTARANENMIELLLLPFLNTLSL